MTCEVHDKVVGPREQPVLVPPPLGHNGHVEAEEEGQVPAQGAQVAVEVGHDLPEEGALIQVHPVPAQEEIDISPTQSCSRYDNCRYIANRYDRNSRILVLYVCEGVDCYVYIAIKQ